MRCSVCSSWQKWPYRMWIIPEYNLRTKNRILDVTARNIVQFYLVICNNIIRHGSPYMRRLPLKGCACPQKCQKWRQCEHLHPLKKELTIGRQLLGTELWSVPSGLLGYCLHWSWSLMSLRARVLVCQRLSSEVKHSLARRARKVTKRVICYIRC